MMKEYYIQIKEVYRQDVFITASSKEEAIKEIEKGKGIFGDAYYECTLEPDTWIIHESKKK